ADVASVKRTEEETAPHLAACIGTGASAPGAMCLELAVTGFGADDEPAHVSVDRTLAIEELLVRPLTPLVAAMGPFAGAIVRGDGAVRLALDAHALAPRARALEKVSRSSRAVGSSV
ncbi:MAG TPA: hypothetical protein VH054_04525, partial [Polyangiaceae bacterium]|nr:hypothetical protein [Polyangiaceae bacterium]